MFRIKVIFITVLIIFLLIIGGLVYFLIFQKPAEQPPQVPSGEKTAEEILQSLTAPGAGEEVSEDILKSLTAPK